MGKITASADSTRRAEFLRLQYSIARIGLLAAIVLTLLNCIFAFFDSVFFSSLSWVFPYAILSDALFSTGRMYTPREYEEYWDMTSADMMHPDYIYLVAGIALAVIGVLVVCWIFSKKQVGWMIAAAALLVADRMFVLYWYPVTIDFLSLFILAACLLGVLINGIVAYYRLKVIAWTSEDPAPQETVPAGQECVAQGKDTRQPTSDSPVLHPVDYRAKSKILLACDVQGYAVCYRRVGRINELAINKMVYDTADTGRHQQPHELRARVDGHEIMVGMDASSQIYVRFDGELVKKKARVI